MPNTLLRTAHQQSLTITFPPSIAAGGTLKFTFPLHPSITTPDPKVNALRETLTRTQCQSQHSPFPFPSPSTPTTATPPSTPRIPSTHTILTLPPTSLFSTGLHWHESHDEYIAVLKGYISITVEGTTRVVGVEEGVMEVKKGVVHGFERGDTPYALKIQKARNGDEKVGREVRRGRRERGETRSTGKGEDEKPESGEEDWVEERDGDERWKSEDVVVLEFTLPLDPHKELLFRNGVSAFLDHQASQSSATASPASMFAPLSRTFSALSLLPRVILIMATMDQYPLLFPALPKWVSWLVVKAMFVLAVPALRFCGWRSWEREWTPRELWGEAADGEGRRWNEEEEGKGKGEKMD